MAAEAYEKMMTANDPVKELKALENNGP